ncbi:hypothetical protein BpHYR1_022327 [Brachionus plicatilis]|uniref:Uncharacterized protein n=1 Tax=Brachionus plicatilis TaxID=10195 RepID=A0A3M7QCI2_BRAPC|nr:hypothetical protein BpHYR1_022327 [Brachionus plicatilis]
MVLSSCKFFFGSIFILSLISSEIKIGIMFRILAKKALNPVACTICGEFMKNEKTYRSIYPNLKF